MNATVAATTPAMVLAVSDSITRTSTARSAVSIRYATPPTTPNFPSSWTRCWNRRYSSVSHTRLSLARHRRADRPLGPGYCGCGRDEPGDTGATAGAAVSNSTKTKSPALVIPGLFISIYRLEYSSDAGHAPVIAGLGWGNHIPDPAPAACPGGSAACVGSADQRRSP